MLYAPPATFAVSILALKRSWRGKNELSFISTRRVLGDTGDCESGSLKVSLVRGWLLTTVSSQFSQQSSQWFVVYAVTMLLHTCCIMFRTDRICRSQTPPKLLSVAGFLIQSMFSLSSSALIFSPSISWTAAFNSFSAPTKLVPWSLRSSLMGPFRQVKLRNACKNESVPMEWATSICIARLAKQVIMLRTF